MCPSRYTELQNFNDIVSGFLSHAVRFMGVVFQCMTTERRRTVTTACRSLKYPSAVVRKLVGMHLIR